MLNELVDELGVSSLRENSCDPHGHYAADVEFSLVGEHAADVGPGEVGASFVFAIQKLSCEDDRNVYLGQNLLEAFALGHGVLLVSHRERLCDVAIPLRVEVHHPVGAYGAAIRDAPTGRFGDFQPDAIIFGKDL